MEPVSFFMTRPDRSDLKVDPTRPVKTAKVSLEMAGESTLFLQTIFPSQLLRTLMNLLL